MAKLKQYLENSWYRGASQDRQTGYAAQYQYGYGVNTRDMKNGVCLAGGATDDEGFTSTSSFHYFSVGSFLYAFTSGGEVKDVTTRETKCTLPAKTGIGADAAIQFGPMVYLFYGDKIYAANQNTFAYTDVTPQGGYAGIGLTSLPLNYANTFLLFGSMGELWRMEQTLGVPTFKIIREFSSGYMIYGLTQEGNYLKIYTTNRKDTKIHYAKGTFDVEDTGLIQTITINGLSLPIATGISSDLGNDYALFITGNDINVDEYKLCKVQGYSVVDIRHTETFGGQKIFSSNEKQPIVIAADGIVFASMDDGIWTFTEYNGWLRGGCCEFPKGEGEKVYDMYRYEEQLYVCVYDGTKCFQRRYDMHFHPSTYQPNGYIIGRVFDGGCAGLFKKNDQATITYNMPVGTSMELSYRYDRDTFTYDKSNFLSIKKLTDVNSCYDIVVPTTPGQKDIDLLALENNDSNTILLENGNNIMLEDLMVCPFNKTWNLLEYRFDLSTEDNTKTPILFEHSLTYYDYMRKYR